MARTGTNRVRDPSTRTARAIRRTAIRLFALASAGWVLLVPVVMVQFHFPLAITAAATAASVGILLSTVGYFLLGTAEPGVQLLDHERHGLREAYDRARLDALRDGLTGLGNHRAFRRSSTSRSRWRRNAAGRSHCCSLTWTTSRPPTTPAATAAG